MMSSRKNSTPVDSPEDECIVGSASTRPASARAARPVAVNVVMNAPAKFQMPPHLGLRALLGAKPSLRGFAIESVCVCPSFDDNHFGLFCVAKQITLEIERADALATGAKCVCGVDEE